jgi:hypothetical protein
MLCCGAIETARLLLLSSSPAYPDGLANSSGQVGRNVTFHEDLYAVGLFDRQLHESLYGWSGNYMNTISFDFYATDDARGHLLGGFHFASMLGHPINWTFPGRPTWGQAAKDADRDFFNHSLKLGYVLHDLPRESNRVDLSPTVRDAWGLPVARITHMPHPNDYAQGRWHIDKNVEILQAAGACKIYPVGFERVTGNCCHEHGTARMGDDPRSSVVNRWCRAHDIPNLYVLDGSVFPTACGVTPTLTIMANAWRCCEYIVHEGPVGARRGGERPRRNMGEAPGGPVSASQANWPVADRDAHSTAERLFFTAAQWATIEAAIARIIPTDHDPGAREANVVRFIDHFLSGTGFIYASADGSGFLDIEGKEAEAWRSRIEERRRTYREGIAALDALSATRFSKPFAALTEAYQDQVLEELSGRPKPRRVTPDEDDDQLGGGGPPPSNQPVNDEGLSFFEMLAFHVRQGFYADPVYGGNADHVGWRVIGFPGPRSLQETRDGSFTTLGYLPAQAGAEGDNGGITL